MPKSKRWDTSGWLYKRTWENAYAAWHTGVSQRLARPDQGLPRAQVEARGTLYGVRSDGAYIARTKNGDRVIEAPGEWNSA